MPGQIDAVMNNLNTLTAGTTTNRAEVFEEYSRNLTQLEHHAKSVAHARDDAEKNSQKYFREWLQSSRSYKDPAKRDAAIQSLEAGRSQTDQARAYLNQGAGDFRSLTDQLNGIRSTLGKDMSPATVQKVGSSLGPVLDKANNVKQYIARLDEQIDAALAAR
jgi:ABC-type transporter Mla subunit MlaD